MIISFRSKDSPILSRFLNNWQNPDGMLMKLINTTYVEFSIKRLDDLVIISQKNFYDVIAKIFLLSGVAGMLIAYTVGSQAFFIIGGVVFFVSLLWLSKYVRFFMVYIKLKQLGHKEKIELVNDTFVIQRLLLELDKNVSK